MKLTFLQSRIVKNSYFTLVKVNRYLCSHTFSWNQPFTVLMWNQHLCYHTFSWDQHFAVSEVKSAVTHSFEINSSFLKWNQHLCSQAFSWNPYFTLFKLNQHLCSHAFSWNQHFTVFEVKSTPLRSHILNIFELMHWQEINVSLFFEEKSTS